MRIAARCCFTVGTDPGWVRMYAATWSGETSRNPRPRASHHARKLPYRPPVRRPRPRVRDPPREELQIPPPVAGPASTITCGRTISPPCPSRPPAPRPPAPEPPSSFRHHLSPTADSPVDERLEPLVVVPERVGQRVELLQRMLRPAEPHLDPVPFDGDPLGAGSPASRRGSRRAASRGSRRGPTRRPPPREYVRTRRRLSDAGGGARGPPRSTGAGASNPRCGFRSRRPGRRTPAPSSPRRTVHPARETGPGRPGWPRAGPRPRRGIPPRSPRSAPRSGRGRSSYAAGAAMTFRPYPPTPCSASFVRKASTVRVSFALAGSAPNCR